MGVYFSQLGSLSQCTTLYITCWPDVFQSVLTKNILNFLANVHSCSLKPYSSPFKSFFNTVCNNFFYLSLVQSQGADLSSSPGHSLHWKRGCAGVLWRDGSVAHHSKPGQQTDVWAVGDQLETVRTNIQAPFYIRKYLVVGKRGNQMMVE